MQVMDIDAESPNSEKVTASSKVKKLETTIRYSSVPIVALGISLTALAVYTAMLVLTEYRSPQPCVSEQCVGTDFGVIDARNTSELNKDNTIINKNTTLIEDTELEVVDARNASTVNEDNTITKKKTKLIEDTAARIFQNLNKDMNPCTDFYEFACGGWIKQNPMPDWATSWNQLVKLQMQVFSDLRELLEVKDDDGLPNSVIKAKSLYRTCMNTDQADDIETIQKVLQKLGLPPRPPTNMSANFRWEEVAGRGRRQLKLDLLLKVVVFPDVKNTSRNRVQIYKVSPWPEKFPSYNIYYNFICNEISKVDNEINAQQFANGILKFSQQLGDIITPVRRNDTHSPVDLSVQQLITGPTNGPPQWKLHDWVRYLTLVFSNTSVALQHQDKVSVWDLNYLQRLSVLLANTKPVIIESYLWWMVFVKTLINSRSLYFERHWRPMAGQQQLVPRWLTCTANVNDHFGHALSYLYSKRHFDNTSTQKAIEMLEEVRSAFAANVKELVWMDSTTRRKTLNKLNAIKNLVGFPAWLLSPEQLDKYYADAEVVEDNKIETYLKLTFAEVKKSLESLREKPDRNSWGKPATEVNAFYSSGFNSVTIPAAILQLPFYGNRIEAINYGSIGAILGHEVTHGFDDKGRRYDEEGNQKEWWSKAALERYQSRVQCIIDQYNKYPMPQLPNFTVNGFNTQGENIADNGGLRAALHAYQLFAKRAPSDSRLSLPGLTDYKPEQLLFLGFAQTWCGISTVRALESQMKTDVHSPNKIRVIGTLSNSKEFADAWSCPAGSPMNPEHKCVLW